MQDKTEDLLQLEEKIEDFIEREVRPMLMMDGGDIQFIHFDAEDGIVYVKFLGACGTCPFKQMTLKASIEMPLKEGIDEVKEVRLLDGDIKITEIDNLKKN